MRPHSAIGNQVPLCFTGQPRIPARRPPDEARISSPKWSKVGGKSKSNPGLSPRLDEKRGSRQVAELRFALFLTLNSEVSDDWMFIMADYLIFLDQGH
jgi:hypothetical protein